MREKKCYPSLFIELPKHSLMFNFYEKKKTLKPLRKLPLVVANAVAPTAHNDDMLDTDSDSDSDSDWSFSSIDSDSDSRYENEALHRTIVLQLKEEDIEVHLATELVSRSTATVNTMLNRYAKLLVWFHSKSEKSGCDINALKLLKNIVLKRFQMITKFYTFLRETQLFKPSTIYNFNEDVSILLNWFAVFRVSRNEEYDVTSNDLYSVNLILKAMRKFYSKERRILACQSVDNTVESLIAAKKWPKGGLKELNDAVVAQMPWARTVCSQPACVHDCTVYSQFMQVLISGFYTGMYHLMFSIMYKICLLLIAAGFRFHARSCRCI